MRAHEAPAWATMARSAMARSVIDVGAGVQARRADHRAPEPPVAHQEVAPEPHPQKRLLTRCAAEEALEVLGVGRDEEAPCTTPGTPRGMARHGLVEAERAAHPGDTRAAVESPQPYAPSASDRTPPLGAELAQQEGGERTDAAGPEREHDVAVADEPGQDR